MNAVVRPRVQFVSKPITAPFRDGTKCLVRELVTHFDAVDARVMGTRAGAPELLGRAHVEPVYGADGAFAPGLTQNLRAALWLLTRRRADVWHFVFAPNPRSSQVGRLLKQLRRVPVVQTIASPPRSFAEPRALLFGDVVVAQSEWTRARFEEAGGEPGGLPELCVVPPPAPPWISPSAERRAAARALWDIPEDAPLFLYPGDLEVSRGAARVGELIEPLLTRLPRAHFVFAYRDKSAAADGHAEALRARFGRSNVHFQKNVPDIHALVAAATAILFPVDDLYGKVDLPIVLLEAMAEGTPVVALDEGPLAGLAGAARLPWEPSAWIERASSLAQDSGSHARLREDGERAITTIYAAERVARAYERIYQRLLSGR